MANQLSKFPERRIISCSLFIILSSCSVSKQIARYAKENIINHKALRTAHVGISMYEPATGKYWYNYQGDKYFVPASNVKIPTCYTAMKYLGDSLVGLRYLVSDDTLILIKPTGDPTFLHPDFKVHPVFTFLSTTGFDIQLLKPHERDYRFPFGEGWQIDDVSETYLVPRSEFPIYGNLVTFFVNADGKISSIPRFFENNVVSDFPCKGIKTVKKVDVFENNYIIECYTSSNGKKTAQVPFRPSGGLVYFEILADTIDKTIKAGPLSNRNDFKVIYSQPTDSVLKSMMHRSDNFFAEQLLLMVSNELLGVMHDAMIIDTILKTDFRDLPQKPGWADGSGLSRYNLFTPQDFVAILHKMKEEFGMERIKVIFPTGGEGTLSNYYNAEAGYIYAKTGTLRGVVALSGYLFTKKDKLLVFSILVNNHQSSAPVVRKAIEKFLTEIRSRF